MDVPEGPKLSAGSRLVGDVAWSTEQGGLELAKETRISCLAPEIHTELQLSDKFLSKEEIDRVRLIQYQSPNAQGYLRVKKA